LKAAGNPVMRNSVEAWAQFSALRATYAGPLRYIAEQTLTRSYPDFGDF